MGLFRFVGGALIGTVLAPVTGGTSLLAVAAASGTAAHLAGKENDKAKAAAAREEGFKQGVKQGNIETAKKFSALLEQSDRMKIGAFALGLHITTLDSRDTDEQLGVIVDYMGRPDSTLLTNYVRSENAKIIRNRPNFITIKNDYLNYFSIEQLKSTDTFVKDIIHAHSNGEPSYNERNFYINDWCPYLNYRR